MREGFTDGEVLPCIFRKLLLRSGKSPTFVSLLKTEKTIMENYMAKAADAFLTGRPYGIRLDFKTQGLCPFQPQSERTGERPSGSVDTLPLEKFDVEDIPLCGQHIVRREDITDIFFYDEKQPVFGQPGGHGKTEGIQQVHLSALSYTEP